MGELNKKGLLKHPLKKTESAIDITVFADKDRFKSGQKFLYSLQAILAHP